MNLIFPINYKNQKAFSLVEIAVVLTIIALLIASVVAGGKLIENAKANSLIASIEDAKSSIIAFETTYNDLPGDFANAYDVWTSSCAASASLCNGDSNGRIAYLASDTTDSESFRAWQHLSIADLTQFPLSGIASTAGKAEIDENVPASGFGIGGLSFLFDDIKAYGSGDVLIKQNVFHFGTEVTGAHDGGAGIGDITWGAVMSPKDMYLFDKKFDDGSPLSGKIWGEAAFSEEDNAFVDCYVEASSSYDRSEDGVSKCHIIFLF
jgi:prepilin-type N-terminal cleavage/methylation domain-containing protein